MTRPVLAVVPAARESSTGTYASLLGPLQAELEALDREIESLMGGRVARFFPEAVALARGGKRLRAVLTIASARLASLTGVVPENAIRVAACVEAIHLSSLLHDDVIDDAAERRGMATLHRRYGRTGAILAGDLLYVNVFRRLIGISSDPILRVVLDGVIRMVEGETEQTMAALSGREITIEDYLGIITRKTADFFGAACEAGGAAAGASEETRAALRRFGVEFGVLFQIVDDILDWSADPATLGKERHADIRCGKLTLPLFLFLEDDPVIARNLIACAADGAVEPLSEEIARRGYLAHAHRMAEQRAAAARAALREAGERTELLEGILDYSIRRCR